jgi:hypothetical protein
VQEEGHPLRVVAGEKRVQESRKFLCQLPHLGSCEREHVAVEVAVQEALSPKLLALRA